MQVRDELFNEELSGDELSSNHMVFLIDMTEAD
jgi:hypothetical protein